MQRLRRRLPWPPPGGERWSRLSLRWRFTLLVAVVTTVVVSLVGSIFTVIFTNRLRSDLDASLTSRLAVVSRIDTGGGLGPGRGPRGFFVPRGAEAANLFAMAHTTGGGVVPLSPNVSGTNLGIAASDWSSAPTSGAELLTASDGGQDYAVALVRLVNPITLTDTDGQPVTVDAVLVGESLAGIDDTVASLRGALVATGVVGVLLAVIAGWLAARRAVRPISELSRAVEDVARDGRVSRRLPVPETADEIAALARSFNASLDRVAVAQRELERTLTRQRQFVADASHELRTPLTTVRTDIEVLRRHRELPEAEQRRVLDGAVGELDRLSRLVADLLLLARADVAGVLRPEPVDWDVLVREALHDSERICAPRAVHASVTPLGTGVADVDAVRRTLRALFENVAHHTPDGSSVWVAARDGDGLVRLSVEDDGPGVDETLLGRVFDRFYQADASRHGEGTGLGLAIARSLVQAHGGSITAARSEHGGLRVDVAVPRVSPQAAAAGPPPAAGPPSG